MKEFNFIDWATSSGYGKVPLSMEQMNMIQHFQQHVNTTKGASLLTDSEVTDIIISLRHRIKRTDLSANKGEKLVSRLWKIIRKIEEILK